MNPFSQTKAQSFISVKEGHFYEKGKPYYFVGANYWYGALLGLRHDSEKGIGRLTKELDFLHAHGINNLRVLAAVEGSGLVSGVERVGPPLQYSKSKFDNRFLTGLDILLDEMRKRNMKAVLYLSNNWEWSGGLLQYLRWNNKIEDSVFRNRMEWEDMRDIISRFYDCDDCKTDYMNQLKFILNHVSVRTGKKYSTDPAIMAWEIANEPRPMRPAANIQYDRWISDVASFIRSNDKNHLITTGSEGEVSTESIRLYQQVHSDKNIDYLTIHIWPKNWGWFRDTSIHKSLDSVINTTQSYISRHSDVARQLQKPLVIEEFGLPRDMQQFDAGSSTRLRDRYYSAILNTWKKSKQSKGIIAGVNFWSFAGFVNRPPGDYRWKKGDQYMGDPPMEEQGLNGVFKGDSTWKIIQQYLQP